MDTYPIPLYKLLEYVREIAHHHYRLLAFANTLPDVEINTTRQITISAFVPDWDGYLDVLALNYIERGDETTDIHPIRMDWSEYPDIVQDVIAFQVAVLEELFALRGSPQTQPGAYSSSNEIQKQPGTEPSRDAQEKQATGGGIHINNSIVTVNGDLVGGNKTNPKIVRDMNQSTDEQ